MQLSDNDMDELFRSAADDYPLRLPQKDWDFVAVKTSAKQTLIDDKAGNKKGFRSNRYILLSLFLLFSVAGSVILKLKSIKKSRQINVVQKPTKETATVTAYTSGLNASLKKASDEEYHRMKLVAASRNRYDPIITYSSTSLPVESGERNEEIVFKSAELVEVTGSRFHIYDSINMNKGLSETAISNSLTTNHKSGLTPDRDKRFYIGLFTGPQFSQVKGQGFGKNGIQAGALLGYSVTNRLAIEIGLSVSGKRYFTKGDYFNMTKVGPDMPPGMKVESLNGNSTVLEIPVRMKYDLVTTDKSNVFGTAGLSWYILANESNKYQMIYNGSRAIMSGNYSGSSSIAGHIGAGYEYKAAKKLTIRIEPYVQIPLKGMGVGLLPVMSTGINLGIAIPVIK